MLTDLSHCSESSDILVWFRGVKVVKGAGIGWILVAGCKVHSYCEIYLTTTHNIVQERVELLYL